MLKSLGFFHKLRSNLYKNPLDIEAEQLRKLKKLLLYTYNNTDYYRQLFDEHKFDPNHIRAANDLRRLPVLKKSDIQENLGAILSKKFDKRKLIVHETSGSSGNPLSIYCDKNSEACNRALRYRSFVENGLSFKDAVVEITSPDNVNRHKSWLQRVGIFKRYKLSILDDHGELFKRINEIRPDVIECYPSVLNLITQSCEKGNLSFRPKVIFTTSELLLPAWRDNIVRFFDCDVRDMYGSTEFYRLAWECEKHEGYHLDIDTHVIEFLDSQDNPVQAGDGYIIVTGLYNYAMPLVRYKIGDIARLKEGKCSCGRSLPLIDSIQGREDDYIKLPSGKTISPRRINLLDSVEGIKEYVTVQVRRDLIKVQAVKNQGYREDIIDSIKSRIREGCLDEPIEIRVELVGKIRRNAGKIRTVISLVK
ncbi:phenylacetate--CoA ligase family protein [Planctomycetota bacterium]